SSSDGRISPHVARPATVVHLAPRVRDTSAKAGEQEINEDQSKKYSAEWWAVKEASDRRNDLKLAKSIVICRGCLPTKSDGGSDKASPFVQNKDESRPHDGRLENRGQV